MRGWMNEGKSYIPPVGIGEVMRAGTVSQVVESKNAAYKVGDFIYSSEGVQQYSVSNGKHLIKIDSNKEDLPR